MKRESQTVQVTK